MWFGNYKGELLLSVGTQSLMGKRQGGAREAKSFFYSNLSSVNQPVCL